MFALADRAPAARLNEWWPATVVGLLAALLLGGPDGNAQGIPLQFAEAQHLAERMAANNPAWRQEFRSYVERGDRQGMVERTKGVLAAYRERCEDKCSSEAVREVVQAA